MAGQISYAALKIGLALLLLVPGPAVWAGPTDEIDLPQADREPGALDDTVAANVDLAWDYAHGGGYEQAHKLLNECEQQTPNEPEYPFTAGALWYQQGDHDQALSAFSRCLAEGAYGPTGLWARLYAADILLIQNVTPQAGDLLEQALQIEGSPKSIAFAANLKQRIRIRQVLTEVNEVGDFTYYLAPYMVPAADRPPVYAQIEADWQKSVAFLGLTPDTPPPTIFFYPSARLLDKYIPPTLNLPDQCYAHHEVHFVWPGSGDVLDQLAPYALYQLQQQMNRGGAGYYLVADSLDEAIRDGLPNGVHLGSFLKVARETGTLPLVESLCDIHNQTRIPSVVAEPSMGLLLRLLHERFPLKEFQTVLTQPGFLATLPRAISSYQVDFDAYITEESDLLDDPVALQDAIDAVPPYTAVPIIAYDLKAELVAATKKYDAGDKEAALADIEALLAREPRYGEARYLIAKDLLDRHEFARASAEFIRVLDDLGPGSPAIAFSHFYLGRIAKLSRDFGTARGHYAAAVASGLTGERRAEAQGYVDAIDRYTGFTPAPDAMPGPDPAAFFVSLDSLMNTPGTDLPMVPGPEVDLTRLATLNAWYHDPKRLRDGVAWHHSVVRFAFYHPGVTVVEVLVQRVNEAGEPLPLWRDYSRRFLLAQTVMGFQVLDYADEEDIYHPPTISGGPSA
ncbi:MAG: hypothetical protein ABI743_01555 [bacterium]